MFKKIFLTILCLLWAFCFEQLGFAQETDTDKDTVRHYILLLDAIAPFRIAIGNRNYFSYMKEMLEIEPNKIHKDYLPYRPNRDIVSIVFFHFPINPRNRKINDKGFYTSRSLILIQGGIYRRRSVMENFVVINLEVFKKLAVSPIALSEVTTLPYINEYIRRLKTNFNHPVDKIYLVSLSDEKYNVEEAGIKSSLKSFDYDYLRNYYNKLRDYMKENFNKLIPLKNIERSVRSSSGGIEKVYFHYYEIKPKVENIELKLIDTKVALDRIAQKSAESGESKMFWKGSNDICLDNTTEYSEWVEWALAPGEEGEWIWQRCDSEEQKESKEKGLKVISAGCRPKCSDNPKESKPLVQIVKKDTLWSTAEDVKRFKQEIWYRGVVDINRENHDYSYPFDFRFYLTPQKVEYVSNEVTGKGESKVPYYYNYDVAWYSPVNLLGFIPFLGSWIEKTEITDDLLKEKLEDKKFCLQVKGYINKEKLSKRFKEYSDTFKDKSITELPAEVLSETSKIRAQDAENRGKWWALIIYLLFISSIFFVHRYFVRPVKIRFIIDEITKKKHTILVDFSSPQRGKEVLAIFELENMVNTLHPLKKNPEMKFSFKIDSKFSSREKVIYDLENLLSIIDNADGKEYKYSSLSNVRFKGKFKIVLNLSAIKDIETDGIGDKIIPFSLSLNTPEVLDPDGEELYISGMRIGTKETSKVRWDYVINLHFKPEKQKKEVSIKPVESSFISIGMDMEDDAGKNRVNYALDYTSKRSFLKLFDIKIKNSNFHHFSYPVQGKFSFKANDSSNNPISNVFYLSETEIDSLPYEGCVREIPVHLRKSEEKRFNLYIKFEDFANPVDHRDYSIISYFDDEIFRVLNISINRSKEKTEASIQLLDEDEPVPLDDVYYEYITHDNRLLVHKNSQSTVQVSLEIPKKARKGIKEDRNTKLFSIDLRNSCNTRTGFYTWQIKNIAVIEKSHIEFYEDAIKLAHAKDSGKIEDQWDSEEKIDFYLDLSKVKNFLSYHITFSLKFSLQVQLFPTGDDKEVPAHDSRQKQIDFLIGYKCFHDVKDNYLVIDFGTSTICAYYHAQYPDTAGDNFFQIPLQSPAYQLPSEEGLLPSIINLRNTITGAEPIKRNDDESTNLATAGSEHFVDLPALNDIFGLCPDLVLTSVELLVVQGRKIVPIPESIDYGYEKREFIYIGENGSLRKGYPPLSSVLKSCYENLLKNYIEVSGIKYKKVLLIYPNVYNRSHFSFLENEVLKDVFVESRRVYFENIRLESEANCVLYYYLSKRGGYDVPVQENVLVVDIGASLLCISYARVIWEKEMDVVTPSYIEVIKRDGIALAGDTLDKAIALQVHDLLKRFNEYEDFKYTNQIASPDDRRLDSAKKLDIKKIMFDFKIIHILEFKKSMSAAKEDEIVYICLGDNERYGLGALWVESLEINLEVEPFLTAKLVNRYGKLYLGMKKKEWLSLPYLKRFDRLYIEKLKEFTRELEIPGSLTLLLSGGTSLWPSIPKIFINVFNGKQIHLSDIWSEDSSKRKIEQKKTVTLGAIQKATTWNKVTFQDAEVSYAVAIRYQKGADSFNPDSWQIETFKKDPQITIDLTNSPYFELGVKTSMDFVSFIGADAYKRDDYCKKDKKITITLEKMADGKGYNFYVQTDRFTKGKGTRLRHVLTHETAYLRTKARYWPVREVQLREIPPEQFDENV